MPDAAREVNHDDGFVAIANTSLRFCGEELRECQSANSANLNELSSRNAITECPAGCSFDA